MTNQRDSRACSSCNKFMLFGYTNEDEGTYYCTKKCLNSSVSTKKQHEEFENESLYYTDWVDDTTVFNIFDNQYITLEDAEFIQREFGNPSNRIKVLDYDCSRPIFTIENNQQIELDI